MSVSSTLISAVAIQRQKLVQHLRAKGALTPASAIPVDSLPKDGLGVMKQLKSQGLVKVNAEGGLYLDMARLKAERETHRMGAWILIIFAVLAGAAVGVLALISYL